MARKETRVTIDDRGNELTFHLREMSASQLHSWLTRALLLAANGDMDGGMDIAAAGEFLAKNGLRVLRGLDYAKAEPLIHEMWGCASLVIDKLEKRVTPDMIDDHVQDVRTIVRLEVELLKLNLGFFTESAASSDSPKSSASKTRGAA